MKYILFALVCTVRLSFAQNIDSLKLLVKNDPADTTLARLYGEILDKTSDMNDMALYGELEYKLAESKLAAKPHDALKNFYLDHLAHALSARGAVNYGKENYMECFHNFKEAEKIYTQTNNAKGLASTANNLGVIYDWFGDTEHSLECYTKALPVLQKSKDTAEIASTSYNLGLLYFEKGNFSKTEELYIMALACYKSVGDFEKVAEIQNNLALLKYNSGDLNKALEYSETALATGKEHKDKKAIAVAKNKLATIYQDQGKFDKARAYYDEALVLLEELNQKEDQATLLRNYSRLFSAQKDLKKAEEYATRALQLAQQTGSFVNIRDEAEVLCKILNSAGKNSTEPCRLFSVMNDSIKNEDARKRDRFLAFKEEYERYDAQSKKDNAIAAQNENADASSNRMWLYIVIGVAVLAIVILVFSKKRS